LDQVDYLSESLLAVLSSLYFSSLSFDWRYRDIL